jgi:hypothetical protein
MEERCDEKSASDVISVSADMVEGEGGKGKVKTRCGKYLKDNLREELK